MKVLARIVAFVVAGALGIPVGTSAGCRIYEASGPDHAQCGYEFEGVAHVIVATLIAIVVLGFIAQWMVGRWFASRRSDDEAGP